MSVQNANAGNVTINLGHGGGEKSAYQPLATKFAELAAKYSNGSLEVKVRCCAQLIKEDEAFKAMQLGTVDMSIITGNNLSPHFALTDAFVLPYIFEDKAHVIVADMRKQKRSIQTENNSTAQHNDNLKKDNNAKKDLNKDSNGVNVIQNIATKIKRKLSIGKVDTTSTVDKKGDKKEEEPGNSKGI